VHVLRLIVILLAVIVWSVTLEAAPHASREAAIALLRSGGILSGKTRVADASWIEEVHLWVIHVQHPDGKITGWTVDADAKSFQYLKPKAVAVFAPKPDYPAEARARHLTGSGVVMLDVDIATGEVMSAHMLQSMGHKILDDAALDAFRKWRFKPGKAAPHITIPIRYSMNGTTS
jgi:TonB family protein